MLTVVIPNWNGKHLLGACLDSLQKQTTKHRVIVVDNGSTDGSIALVKEQYPNVTLIALPVNLGFAGGVNAGLTAAIEHGDEFVALLNNDAVAEVRWLEQLSKTASINPDVGIVTSKMLRADKTHLDSTGECVSIWGLAFPRGRNEVDAGQYDEQTKIFAASGGASLYRTAMLKKIGLFDEAFFAYFEDVDISFRAQLAGWQVRYEPNAVVYHAIGATSATLGNFTLFHSVKNFVLLYVKNMPHRLALKYALLFTLQYGRMFITSTLRGKGLVFMKSLFKTIALLPRVRRQRRAIQAARTVPLQYIDDLLHHGRPPRPPKI